MGACTTETNNNTNTTTTTGKNSTTNGNHSTTMKITTSEKSQLVPLWTPNYSELSALNLEKLRKHVNQKYGLSLETYADLHKWSCQSYSKFWEEVWYFTKIRHSASFTSVVDETIAIDSIPKWFTGARLNYAENLLENGEPNSIAVYYKGEGHPQLQKLTFAQLRSKVSAWARAFKNAGVQEGDVVAGILPNGIETLAALLGAASLGAIWTCTSPDYGITGVVERFKQTEPKIIISVNGVFYNGKIHSMISKLKDITHQLSTVQHVVVIPFVEHDVQFPSDVTNWISSTDFLQDFAEQNIPLEYEQVPFDHPLFIMYSSGTTGKPKCMVHSAGGSLIKHLEEHIFQSDLKKSDITFYFTTVGWMMYNWLISSLQVGSAIVLYDGAPSAALWDLIDEIGITIFGTSAKWLAVQEDTFVKNSNNTKLVESLNKTNTPLRMVLSTGSPLRGSSFEFIYNHVKRDVVVGSISGGTDIIGCFMGQNPMLPVHTGEIQSYHLGCDLDCFTEDGVSTLGDRGELVVRTPFPSMPTHFYNDPNGELYHKAYFGKFENIWAHGDFMMVNPSTKGIIMLGRSDATLNPNGVRFGSAEIYQIVDQFKEVVDSVCVAQRNSSGSDERVVLFLRLNGGTETNEDLITRLKKAIREQLSPRHVPAIILPIADIPYTISGKKVEIAVRNMIEGIEVKNSGALANPTCLELYKNIPQLAVWS